jgi:hypothetical protein
MAGTVQDVTERKLAEAANGKLIAELREALQNVNTLSGLLPICMHCKERTERPRRLGEDRAVRGVPHRCAVQPRVVPLLPGEALPQRYRADLPPIGLPFGSIAAPDSRSSGC